MPLVFLLAVIHQTTTANAAINPKNIVFLLAVIHQTTTAWNWTLRDPKSVSIGGYTSNHNWLKAHILGHHSVSIGGYTSNHNKERTFTDPLLVFLLAVIHQTTTKARSLFRTLQCFYWRLYIKPQPVAPARGSRGSVSIGGYTSNHNSTAEGKDIQLVFLLAVIHQTTTM